MFIKKCNTMTGGVRSKTSNILSYLLLLSICIFKFTNASAWSCGCSDGFVTFANQSSKILYIQDGGNYGIDKSLAGFPLIIPPRSNLAGQNFCITCKKYNDFVLGLNIYAYPGDKPVPAGAGTGNNYYHVEIGTKGPTTATPMSPKDIPLCPTVSVQTVKRKNTDYLMAGGYLNVGPDFPVSIYCNNMYIVKAGSSTAFYWDFARDYNTTFIITDSYDSKCRDTWYNWQATHPIPSCTAGTVTVTNNQANNIQCSVTATCTSQNQTLTTTFSPGDTFDICTQVVGGKPNYMLTNTHNSCPAGWGHYSYNLNSQCQQTWTNWQTAHPKVQCNAGTVNEMGNNQCSVTAICTSQHQTLTTTFSPGDTFDVCMQIVGSNVNYMLINAHNTCPAGWGHY